MFGEQNKILIDMRPANGPRHAGLRAGFRSASKVAGVTHGALGGYERCGDGLRERVVTRELLFCAQCF